MTFLNHLTSIEKDQNLTPEISEKFNLYIEILLKWNRSINLISRKTESDVVKCHVEDSLKLLPHIKNTDIISDLGSGGGFPGIIIAIAKPEIYINLIESDKRKCAFLTNIVFNLKLKNVNIIEDRIENISEMKSNIITSRALASVKNALDLLENIKQNATCLFIKGKKVFEEVKEAEIFWDFKYEIFPENPSIDERTYILKLYNIKMKNEKI